MKLADLRRQLREVAERVQGWKCLCHSELNEGLHTCDCLATMTHWEEEACTPDNVIRLLDALDRAENYLKYREANSSVARGALKSLEGSDE